MYFLLCSQILKNVQKPTVLCCMAACMLCFWEYSFFIEILGFTSVFYSESAIQMLIIIITVELWCSSLWHYSILFVQCIFGSLPVMWDVVLLKKAKCGVLIILSIAGGCFLSPNLKKLSCESRNHCHIHSLLHHTVIQYCYEVKWE